MTIHIGPILVVEDIASVRDLIEVTLKMRGYEVITAADGLLALERIAERTPAVVITDILMPRMDGFALAHKLRSDPTTSDIPLIFLSATYVSAEDEQFALNLGAMRFLPKPIDADELFIVVADALTGNLQPPAPINERAFYAGYRQRLGSKLAQKSQQVARSRQQLETAAPDQRDTYQRLLDEAQHHYDEIQRELDVLTQAIQNLG